MKEWKTKNRTQREIDKLFDDVSRWLISQVKNKSYEEAVNYYDSLPSKKIWSEFSRKISKRIIYTQSIQNARTWKEAARKSQAGKKIYNQILIEMKESGELEELLDYSTNLISTLPRNISNKVIKKVSTMTFKGERSSKIAQEISDLIPEYTKASASLIARTESARMQAAITQTRAQSININWYLWRTVKGPRVRSSHRHMEDVLCNYNFPPSPEKLDKTKRAEGFDYYNPGGTYNCRCFAEPLLDIDDIKWPHKVHYKGKIVMMTKRRFMEIYNG